MCCSRRPSMRTRPSTITLSTCAALRARKQQLPDVDSPTANGALQRLQVEHDDIAAPARLEPADRPSRRRRPWRLRPMRARRPRPGSSRGCRGSPCTRCRTCASRTSANMSSSSARPMSSSPSATLTPDATSRRSGATPVARRRFEEQLWTTVAPVRASRSMSASRSQTPWASALRSPSTPISASRSSSRPPAKASPQARCSGLSSACRWMPRPELAAAAEAIASTSASLAHCGAMIANWALSSGSPASSRTSASIVSTYASRRHARAREATAPAPAGRPGATR